MPSPGSLLRLYGICGLAGTTVAVRRGERARLLGIPFPGGVGVQAATIGTGLTAPIPLLSGIAVAGQRLRPRFVAGLSVLFLVGALGEPVTWRTLRHPSSDPLLAAIVVANLVLPLVAGVPTRRERRA